MSRISWLVGSVRSKVGCQKTALSRMAVALAGLMAVAALVLPVMALAGASGSKASRIAAGTDLRANALAQVLPGAGGGASQRVQALEAKRWWRATPAAGAQRVRSRMAFHGLSVSASWGLLDRDFASELHTAGLNLARAGILAGRHVRYLGAYKALIRGPHGPQFVYSSAPLLAGPPERRGPVDLGLDATADGFVPRNPVRDVSISRRLAGGVGLWSKGLRVYADGRDVSGTDMGGRRVFYANTAPDTDAGVQPTLGGVELFAVLRSRLSPEKLSYRFALPRGAALQADGGHTVVVRGGQVLARVSAPSAVDAQGSGVPVSMSVVGDQLVLSIPHRAQDVAYPLFVDPYLSLEEGAPGWSFHQGVKNSEGKFTEGSGPFESHTPGFILGPRNVLYDVSAAAEWLWQGSPLTRLYFAGSTHFSPDEAPKPIPFRAAIEMGCNGAEIFVSNEGELTPAPKCTDKGVHIWLENQDEKEPVNEGDVLVYLLFATEGTVGGPEHWGGSNPGEPHMHGVTCGEPVDCASGNQFETQTDMTVPGRGLGLNLARTYNSQAAVKVGSPGTFGYGWSSTYTAHLALSEAGGKGTATVSQGNGSTVPFELNPAGEWVPNGPWVQAKFAKVEGVYIYTLPDQSTMRFNKEGKLLSEADRDGNTITLSYTEAGRLEKAEDAAGRAITFSYNEEGLVKEAKAPAGTVSYGYTSGNLTKVTDLDGHEWKFEYDPSRQMIAKTDPRNHTFTTEYDEHNRVIVQKDPLERIRKWEYAQTAGGTETTIKDPKGTLSIERFNAAGLPTSITHASGTGVEATTTYEYDESYNLIAVKDPNGHTRKYGFNGAGDRTSETDALEHKTEWTYNSTHDVTSKTDPMGNITKIGYTATGDPATVTQTLAETGEPQTVTYSHADRAHTGDVTAITDPVGHQTKMIYGTYGLVVKLADPLGHTTSYEYNTAGRRTAMVSPLGNILGGKAAAYTTKYTYDALGQLLSITDPMSHKTSYEYDADGNRTHGTDPDGHKTGYVFDADNELEKVERPGGSTLTQTYNPEGALLTQTNGLGNTTTYTYDALDHMETAADPDKRKTAYVFDGWGNLISKTDPQGRVTKYSYDADNRLTGIVYSDGKTPNVTVEYNNDNERTQMKDGTGSSSYAYDSLGRLLKATDGNGNQVIYAYDLANHLTGITYPGKHKVTHTLDEAGRVTAIEDWKSNRTTMKYDANNNLATEVLPAGTGVVDTTTFDADNNPTTIIDQKNTTKLATYLYTRDNNEQLTSTTTSQINEAPQAYVYTELNQLKLAGPKPTQVKYFYNPAGDLTSTTNSTLTYDNAEQLCWTQTKIILKPACNQPTIGSISYGYDQDGNRTSQGKAATLVTLAYDQANRLVKYNGKATYAYNGDGLRLNATTTKTTEHYVWDNTSPAPHPLEDATNKYVYSPDGTPLEQITNTGEAVTYLHHDQLGNTRLLTNTSGETTGTYSYTPYGSPTHTGSATTPLQYTGQYTDPETGFVYLRARYYDPVTGQYITRDPLTPITQEPYSYANDNPINDADPTGLLTLFGYKLPTHEQLVNGVNGFLDGFTNGVSTTIARFLGENVHSCSSEFELFHEVGGAALIAAALRAGDDAPVSDENVATTPSGRPFTDHYLTETGPLRNIPGSVVDETIDHGEIMRNLPDRTVFYDPKNDVTVVLSKTTGKIMSARRGP